MEIGACQTPEILADVDRAVEVIRDFAAAAPTADLLLFPECFLPGYLVTDQHLREHAVDLGQATVPARLAGLRPTLVVGLIERADGHFYNTAAVISRGRVVGRYRKTHLTGGESAFTPGDDHPVFDHDGTRFGINICYDTQFPGPAAAVAAQGAEVLLVPAQNMMRRDKADHWQPRHHEIRGERARETDLWLISADVTGARGDTHLGLGPTSVLDPSGAVVAQVPAGETGIVTFRTGSRSGSS